MFKEDYPWDVRVEKIVRALVRHGHDVVLVCRNLDRLPEREEGPGFLIRRLPPLRRWPRVVRKLLNVPAWCNPLWLAVLWRNVRAQRTQVIIVRDLPLMLAGIVIGRLLGARVVFDMAECYPEMYRSIQRFTGFNLTRAIVRNPAITAVYERLVLSLCDHALVVIEESRDRLLRMGVPGKKITVVSNTPDISRADDRVKYHEGRELRLVYVGFLTRLRGLDVLLEGVRKFLDMSGGSSPIKVDLIGKGSAREELEERVGQLDLGPIVTIHGWLEPKQVEGLLDRGNVGVLPYRVCEHWNHTIPNKLFDYMAAGMPVLATEVGPIARIVRAVGCGVICRDQDPDDLAQCLSRLANPEIRQSLASAGVRGVRERHNWEMDERRLVAAICSVVGGARDAEDCIV